MNHPNLTQRKSRAYHRAFKRLDALLENGEEGCNAQKIEILGQHMFGDLWQARQNQSAGLAATKTP
jgi:hypothetical protein